MAAPAPTPPSDAGPVKTALVLSGGGAHGAVEIGFYKAIVESGIRIDLVLGTSIGAINGAMIASGLPPDEVYECWRNTAQSDLVRWNWRELLTRGLHARSLFDGRHLRRFLERVIPARAFSDLAIPFVAVACDLQTAEVVALDDGDLITAVQASTAIPGMYPPVEVNGRQLVDGGILRQIPLDLAVDRGATTCIVALAECRNEPRDMSRGFIEAWSRSFSLAIMSASRLPGYFGGFASRTRLILLEPCFSVRIRTRSIFDLSHTDELVQLGYDYAMERLEQEGLSPAD